MRKYTRKDDTPLMPTGTKWIQVKSYKDHRKQKHGTITINAETRVYLDRLVWIQGSTLKEVVHKLAEQAYNQESLTIQREAEQRHPMTEQEPT